MTDGTESSRTVGSPYTNSVLVVSTACLGVGLLLVSWRTSHDPLIAFLTAVTGTLSLLLAVTLWTVTAVHRDVHSLRVTRATWITATRGGLVAFLAGFLFVDRPTETAALIPAGIFAVAISLDAVDGTLARVSGTVSELGARLDGQVDALAVLVGATIAVRYGAVPVVYLTVGLAQYVFITVLWVRRGRGRPVYSLPQSQLRRLLGATQMIVILLALLPVVDRTITYPLAIAAMVPFLGGYVRDWIAATGHLQQDR